MRTTRHLPAKSAFYALFTVSASVTPDPARYPPSAANDGSTATLYWPGALVGNNAEWLQLTWDAPQTFDKLVVRFLQHSSMPGRTIHLQKTASWLRGPQQ